MRTLFRPLLVGLLLIATPVLAADLTEKQALAKAIGILKGDPYGASAAEVAANITERRLGPRSATVCGGGASPVWAFHVVVPRPATNPDGRIDGWLVIDARSGRLVCANLPFLD
jgi:hypothetical protein